MIAGQVSRRHALVPVTIRLPGRPEFTIEFIVDTGYTDYLTLPPAAVAALGLPYLHRTPAELADETEGEYDVYALPIVWNGMEQVVPVLAMGRRSLLGTALLDGNEAGW
jgi:clan AA aspartic protease